MQFEEFSSCGGVLFTIGTENSGTSKIDSAQFIDMHGSNDRLTYVWTF